MTTLVTVKANGPCYPARVVKTDANGTEMENRLISSGYSFELWVGVGQTVAVTEEYHEKGYPPPSEAD
jgi:hypothetical protein